MMGWSVGELEFWAVRMGAHQPFCSLTYMELAMPNWRREAAHWTVRAWRRARLRAGRRMEMRRAMMPMTTRSSTRVKAVLRLGCDDMGRTPPSEDMTWLTISSGVD